MDYELAKALHIISFTAWMAGMFYLPRLLAYHAGVSPHGETSLQFKVMERRLLKAIMTPAMVATWGSAFYLAIVSGYGAPGSGAHWLMAKFGLVLVLSGLHGYFAGCVKRFARDANSKSPRFYKIVNELVTVFFVAIVLLVVLKPF